MRCISVRASIPGRRCRCWNFSGNTRSSPNSVRGPLLEDKIVDFVLELAKVTDTIVSPEELVKEPEEAVAADATQADTITQQESVTAP